MSGEAALVEAARAERDRRAESYPAKIATQRATVGGDGRAADEFAEALTIDYQCWVAIAEWLESDRFFSFTGGAEPDSPDAPIIRWPELEGAAERALTSAGARCDRLFEAGKVEEYEAACARRAQLWAIHRKVKLRRVTIDAINAAFRQRQRQEIAA